ncbi:uncharacterized protein LOC144149927 isoform X4 [Haemaphysalis longicornis]
MSTGGLPQFASLFEMVSACGLCEMPTDIDVLDSSGPCDSILGSVLRQLEALVTGSTTAVSAKEGFEPPSNLAAVLAIGWLVAQHGVLETLLLGITSPVTCHTVAKAEQQHPAAGEADSGSCQLAWSRARLSLRALDSALQQHASLVHQACHPPGAAELSRYQAHLQQQRLKEGGLPNQLASLAEGCPGFWP